MNLKRTALEGGNVFDELMEAVKWCLWSNQRDIVFGWRPISTKYVNL